MNGDVHDIREDFNDLEAIGELDNTLIVVSGDHGIPGFPRAKCNLYNFGTEVAMAVRWPEKVSRDASLVIL